MFLTGSKFESGIIAIRFYIRGKPWVVSIDDKLFWYQSGDNKYLKFTQTDYNSKTMWAPILEKAWAKVKGSYE